MEESSSLPTRPDESSHPRPSRSMTRRVIVWIVALLLFAGLFLWVLRSQNTPQKAAQAGRAAMMGGQVSVVTATAQKGDTRTGAASRDQRASHAAWGK